MSQVFVLDTNKQPLNPVHPGCARLLLKQGKAAVYRRYPFTLILKRTVERPELQPLLVKIDPGSQTTGLALVNDASGEVVWAAEVREYVLLKWHHQCAYCDARAVPLELDHVQPRARGGSNRVSNLTLACTSCNQRRGNQDVRDFLKGQPERLARLLGHLKAPLKDAAAVNMTRWALYERLIVPLQITATGHGLRQMCRMDTYGFPCTGPKQHKRVQGFQTGDLVWAVVTSGTKQGTYFGKVAIRSRGTFNITTAHGVVTDIHHRWCRLEARADGYTYQQRKEAAFPPST